MSPKVLCIGVDGLAFRYVHSKLDTLDTFSRLFMMGTGGKLKSRAPESTCGCWLETLMTDASGTRPREKKSKRGKRRTNKSSNLPRMPLWSALYRAGVSVSAVNIPLPAEPGDIDGVLEPRTCPFLSRQEQTRPEQILMMSEEHLAGLLDVSEAEGSDVLLFGLPSVDLIARSSRSEPETVMAAHKSVDTVIGRAMNALEADSVVVFSPFATRRRTRSKRGAVSSRAGLWVVNSPNIPRGQRVHARNEDLAPLIFRLLDISEQAASDAKHETFIENIEPELVPQEI